ncbi:hypothetical protein EV122DRAFT_212937 [Schizophyllum commune]
MKRYQIHFHPDNAQIHCIAHVVNLVVQKILAVAKEVDEDPDVLDYYETFLKHFPVHFDVDDDEELKEWQAEADRDGEEVDENGNIIHAMDMSAVDEEDGLRGTATRTKDGSKDEDTDDEDCSGIIPDDAPTSALDKVCATFTKIVVTPTSRAAFRKILATHFPTACLPNGFPIRKLMVVRDMKAIDDWVWQHKQYRHLMLSATEWDSIKTLNSILQIFTKVTETMSTACTPTLCWTLPMYEKMRKSLQVHLDNQSLGVTLRAAVAAGLKKLEYYYDLAKKSQYTMLATLCHPSLRANWFRNLGEDKYNEACSLLKHVYDKYAMQTVPTHPSAQKAAPATGDDFLDEIGACPDAPCEPSSSIQSECDRWLLGDGGKAEKLLYPLAWWKVGPNPFLRGIRAHTPVETRARVPSYGPHSTGLLGDPCNVCLRRAAFLKSATRLRGYPLILQGGDRHRDHVREEVA